MIKYWILKTQLLLSLDDQCGELRINQQVPVNYSLRMKMN